jgi:hypothetical protein
VSKTLQGVLLLADLSGGVTDVICGSRFDGDFRQSTLRAPRSRCIVLCGEVPVPTLALVVS